MNHYDMNDSRCDESRKYSGMKRLGIFVIYDREGLVDRYIYFLMKSLKEIADRLVIVVNGLIDEKEIRKMEQISEDIVYRDNRGYDAGGYKDALLHYIGREELRKYDELVLCNDTCYGPFIPFSRIWEKMNKKEGDFWGINCIRNGLTDHMQAYFLVFRKTLLKNDFIYNFFETEINEKSSELREVIAVFEKGLYKKLIECDYKPAEYIESNNLNLYMCGNVLLREYGFPFLKKKCFDKKYNDNSYSVIDALQWIMTHTSYNIEFILENARRLFGFPYTVNDRLPENNRMVYGPVFDTNYKEMNAFIDRVDKLFIYGCGAYAKEIYHLYVKKSGKLNGFVVSDDNKENISDLYGYPVYRISELDENAPLIVAMSKKNTEEVRNSVGQRHAIFLF